MRCAKTAMNTTHTTFNVYNKNKDAEFVNAQPPPYTVIGGTERAGIAGISAVLLSRGSRYPRRQIFTELGKAGFDFIVSVENPAEHYGIDELIVAFPSVRFILLSEKLNIGDQINIAAQEIRSPLFFVLWNDLKILYGGTAEKISERMLISVSELGRDDTNKNWYKRLCTVPVFQSSQFEPLPTAVSPILKKHKFEIVPYAAIKEDAPSLYPYHGVGVYDRIRFLNMGGFDTGIKNPYWQLMDFGFRSWLWGEEIRCTHHIRLRYDGVQAIEEVNYDENYWRFFLKNLMPVVRNSGETKTVYAHLPLKKLFSFLMKTRQKPVECARCFFMARKWVHHNKHNWKTSAEVLIRHWDLHA
jgi:hypothetical protein